VHAFFAFVHRLQNSCAHTMHSLVRTFLLTDFLVLALTLFVFLVTHESVKCTKY